MRVLMLENPRSGAAGRRKRATRAVEALRREGAAIDVLSPGSAEEVSALAFEAKGRYDVVLASGGDGTLHAVVNGLARCERSARPRLAIFPTGRGNDFAAHLGIETPGDTLEALAAGRYILSDLGRGGEAYFLSIAGTGFDARASRRARETPLLKGSALYTYAALRTLIDFEPVRATLAYDGGRFDGTITFAAVGNSSRYGGGMRITPKADVSDGLLDLCLVKAVSKGTLLRVFPRVFSGRHLEHESVDYRRTAFVEVETSEPIEVFADGEPIGWTPMRIEAVPAALEIYARA